MGDFRLDLRDIADGRDFIDKMNERRMRAEVERLERDAIEFIENGYRPDELMIAIHDHGMPTIIVGSKIEMDYQI